MFVPTKRTIISPSVTIQLEIGFVLLLVFIFRNFGSPYKPNALPHLMYSPGPNFKLSWVLVAPPACDCSPLLVAK